MDKDFLFAITFEAEKTLKGQFEITFAAENNFKGNQLKRSIDDSAEKKLKGNQLKYIIDDYHFFLPVTTKQIKSKVSEDVPTETDLTIKLDDQSKNSKLVC